jgi:hypothetical protein
MSEMKHDAVREHRIEMEIVVDAYGEEERAMGWHVYLDDNLRFPFKGRCIVERRTSPLRVGETVRVEEMAPEDDCMHEMFVIVEWSGRKLGVPLAQLEGVGVDDETRQAIEDWHYWVAQGYQF